jgi:hypothetical protein
MGKRLLVLSALAAGLVLLSRRRCRRPAQSLPAPDPADELRRKLDEARERQSSAPPSAPSAADEVDARRRSVHERGRAAIDQMRGQTTAE